MTWFHRRLAWRAAWLLVLLSQAAGAQSPEEFLRQISGMRLPAPANPGRSFPPRLSEKIDPLLAPFLAAPQAERGDLIPVVVHSTTVAQAAAVTAEVRARQGEVTAAFGDTVWVRVPAGSVRELASLPAVASVSAQPVDRIAEDPVAPDPSLSVAPPGDGMRAAHLDLLHRSGITGRGVRIGILDRGFGGYSALQRQGWVKAARAQRAFPASYGVENGEVHGAACAEVLSMSAPGADLYLASFDGEQGHMVEAAQWLLSQGVQIINYSGGNVLSPNDGSDPISRFIDQTTRQYGALWVVAAGNYAEQHWSGDAAHAREQGILASTTWAAGQKGLVVTPLVDRLRLVVRWNDREPDSRAPSTHQDIDAYLYGRNGQGQLYEVAHSAELQNGGATRSLETIDLSGKNLAGHPLLLALHAKKLTRNVRIHVFLEPAGGGRLYPSNPDGSILTPACAKSALAVGAVDVMTRKLTAYSSRGPTDDSRIKPEVTAPTNTISWAYREAGGRFEGTSASCPHVAAFAALLKERSPGLNGAALRLAVMRSVTSSGESGSAGGITYNFIDASLAAPFIHQAAR